MNHLPDEALFFIAEEHYPIEYLLTTLYRAPSARTREHFLNVNGHLKGTAVRPGQMIILTPEEPSACSAWESTLAEAAMQAEKEFEQLTERERIRLARQYAMLSDIANYSSNFTGWSAIWLDEKKKRVEQILHEIDHLFTDRLKTAGNLANSDFFRTRKQLFLKLDSTVNGMLRRELFNPSARPGDIKAALGLSSKSIVHQWKANGATPSLPAMTSHYRTLVRMSKAFSTVGYVSIGLTVAGGAANIAEACAVQPHGPACVKSRYVETGKMVGSIAGGGIGGYGAAKIGTAVCVALVGVETVGLGIPVCIAAFGALGAVGGSAIGNSAGISTGSVMHDYMARPRN